jgi:hypothetical protein
MQPPQRVLSQGQSRESIRLGFVQDAGHQHRYRFQDQKDTYSDSVIQNYLSFDLRASSFDTMLYLQIRQGD